MFAYACYTRIACFVMLAVLKRYWTISSFTLSCRTSLKTKNKIGPWLEEIICLMLLTDVQINIKRCLSDGCDTRIHGLRAIGYQRVKKGGVSVCDASAIWYWSLLTSLITASMDTNPAIVHAILQNTQ